MDINVQGNSFKQCDDIQIDFVIPWVDGNDPAWRNEKSKYIPQLQEDNREERYRDWDNLRYWFRGIEKFAPWVHKIYFITWGHIPNWLDVHNERLVIVKHEDFIPREYLPIFNVNPIEVNLHRINGLSEHFVYFNDDTFIINKMSKYDFFKNGLPCETAALNVHCLDARYNTYGPLQAIGIINKYFDLRKVLLDYWKKWFSPQNGVNVFRTIYLLPCPRFPGVYQTHLPTAFLKSTFETLWRLEPDLLKETCKNKFRNKLDYTQWLFKDWQLVSGNFIPRNSNIGKNYILEEDVNTICQVEEALKKRKIKMICINDGTLTNEKFMNYKERIIVAFHNFLPEKSSYEK